MTDLERFEHWHDAHGGGMVVSGDHVRVLWEKLHALDDLARVKGEQGGAQVSGGS